jgi:hypothetical protein
MISVFILGFAALALVQFVVAQWRATWLSAAAQPLSDTWHAETGLEAESIGASDFNTLLDMCREHAVGLKKVSPWLPEVARYYSLLASLKKASHKVLPSVSAWFSSEMTACSRYVAVALDHYIAVDFDRRAAARSI